jgi:hypothetical protein
LGLVECLDRFRCLRHYRFEQFFQLIQFVEQQLLEQFLEFQQLLQLEQQFFKFQFVEFFQFEQLQQFFKFEWRRDLRGYCYLECGFRIYLSDASSTEWREISGQLVEPGR